jgi:hypothetical protein
MDETFVWQWIKEILIPGIYCGELRRTQIAENCAEKTPKQAFLPICSVEDPKHTNASYF